eukprot:472200_1
MSQSLVVVIATTIVSLVHSGTHKFTVDLSSTSNDVYAFWQSCTTMDHAYVALRADFQEQLATTVKELKIEFIRFHSIFDDSIGIYNPRKPTTGNGNSPYSYVNVDKIYDFLQSINIKPLVEMDFMPSVMVPNNSSYKAGMYPIYPVWVGPPTNKTQWYNFVKSFVQHLVDRYGMETVSTWAFDAWNEPNCDHGWGPGGQKSFEDTWNVTANAVKSVNKSFKVGAPGTCGMGWYTDFPQWCHDNKVPLDFFSTHIYPTDQNTPATHNGYLGLLQHLQSTIKKVSPTMQIGNTAYGCTIESDSPSGHNMGTHDTSYNAACFSTFASQFQVLDRDQWFIWSFTGFTDLWDQQGFLSAPFHNGYGWMTQRGIKKPTYHALRLLVEYASDRKYFTVKREDSSESNTTLEVFVTMNDSKNEIAVFVMNWIPHGKPINNETVIVKLNNVPNNKNIPSEGILYRIDSDNCNPGEVWQKQGSPVYPSQKQLDEMVNASNTYPHKIGITNNNGDVTLQVDIPKDGVAVTVIDLS